MPRPALSFGRALILVGAFGAGVAYAWSRYRDPLTGLGQRGFVAITVFELVLALLAAILVFRYRQRALGSLALVFALYFAVPTPSKPGLEIRVLNNDRQPVELKVARHDSAWRRIALPAPAGAVTTYRTAAGNYPENVQFDFLLGTQCVAASASELRQKFVQIRERELRVVEIGKH